MRREPATPRVVQAVPGRCMLQGAQADAAARRQSGFSVWRCFCGAVSRLAWFAQTLLYILLN